MGFSVPGVFFDATENPDLSLTSTDNVWNMDSQTLWKIIVINHGMIVTLLSLSIFFFLGLWFLSFPVTVLVFPPVGAGQSSLAADSPIGACVAQPYWGNFFTDWGSLSVVMMYVCTYWYHTVLVFSAMRNQHHLPSSSSSSSSFYY